MKGWGKFWLGWVACMAAGAVYQATKPEEPKRTGLEFTYQAADALSASSARLPPSTDFQPQAVYAAPVTSCAENGSCYGDYSYDTGRPKTVHVEGYYRSDGSYVRGHYRSAPR